ncbi:MAG: HPP family protein [Planctomycetota bacterium]
MTVEAWTEAPAREVMSASPRTIGLADSLETLLATFVDEGLSGLPVLAGDGRLVGFVTLSDVAAYLADLERGLGRLGEYATRSYLRWGGPPTGEALEGTEELVEGAAPEPSEEDRRWPASFGEEEDVLRETAVEEVMSRDPIGVGPDTPLRELGRVMHERGVHRVLVTAPGERLLGVVSSLDVIAALLRET